MNDKYIPVLMKQDNQTYTSVEHATAMQPILLHNKISESF